MRHKAAFVTIRLRRCGPGTSDFELVGPKGNILMTFKNYSDFAAIEAAKAWISSFSIMILEIDENVRDTMHKKNNEIGK